MTEEKENNVPEKEGLFISNLKRNYKQIRHDRARSLGEDAEMSYRRMIEDIEQEITRLEREQEAELDLSPDTINSLKPAKDFDGRAFANSDRDFLIRIREKKIDLELCVERYEKLFGIEYEPRKRIIV